MFQHVPGAGKVPEKLVMGNSDKKNRFFGFRFSQNRPKSTGESIPTIFSDGRFR